MELAISLENNSYPSLANMDNSIDQQQANGAQVGSGVTTTVMDLPVTLLERNDESAFPRCIHQRALNHSNSINGMKEKSSPAETLSVSTTVGTVGNSQVQAAKVLTIKNLNNENRQINISSNFDNNNQANHSNNSNNNTSQSSTITSLILLQPLNKTHNPPNSGTSAIGRNDCYISTTSTTVLPSFSQHYSEACGSVVPSTDYTYSPTYAQYGNAYGTYGYGSSSGLLNSYYYEGVQNQTTNTTASNQEIRSPLAATRANSLASAASPTGSACTKSESSDIFLV